MKLQNESFSSTINQLQSDLENLDQSVKESEIRLEESQRKIRAQTVFYRRSMGKAPDEETIPEKTMLVDNLKEKNDSILFSLQNLTRDYPDLLSAFQQEIQGKV